MYIATAGLDEVLRWFENGDFSERILCFMVASTVRDRRLLGDVFDNRAIMNSALGDEAAFFLFSDHGADPMISRDEGMGVRLIVPGLRDVDSRASKPWAPMSIADIRPDLKEDVILRTQTMSDAICERFELDRRETLPCLLFLVKSDPEPFVIRTLDAAELPELERFFVDIREIGTLLRTSGMLSLPMMVARTEELVAERARVRQDRLKTGEQLGSALPELVRVLRPYDLTDEAAKIEVSTANRIFDRLGLNRRVEADPDIKRRAEEAVLNEEVHHIMRRIAGLGSRYRGCEAKEERLSSQISENLANLLASEKSGALITVEERIRELCEVYEGRFKWARRKLSTMQFVRTASRVAKVAKDAPSVSAKIDWLARQT